MQYFTVQAFPTRDKHIKIITITIFNPRRIPFCVGCCTVYNIDEVKNDKEISRVMSWDSLDIYVLANGIAEPIFSYAVL